MILLNGFRASGHPDDDYTEYTVTETDAWRLLAIVEAGHSRRINPVVHVTIFSEDLTSENANENLRRAQDDLREAADPAELFD